MSGFKFFEKLQPKESWQYLSVLYKRTLELKARQVLELGVAQGYSTRAFLYALKANNGHLWSMDIADCPDAVKAIAELGLQSRWTFLVGDDLELAKNWKKTVDILFIDAEHTFEQVMKELELYSPFVKKEGIILLHDSLTYDKDVQNAIQAWIKKHPYTYFEHKTKWGLAELKRR